MNELLRHMSTPLYSFSAFPQGLLKLKKKKKDKKTRYLWQNKIEKTFSLIFSWVPIIFEIGKKQSRSWQ